MKRARSVADEDDEPVAPKPVRSTRIAGRATTTSNHSNRRATVSEKDDSEEIEERTVPADLPIARVRVSAGKTLNLGDFQSLRIDCSVEIPCPVGEIEEAYLTASEFVADKLEAEQELWLPTKNRGR